LSYAFSYQSQSSSYFLIRSRQEVSNCSSQLPKGNGNQFQLQTRLEVFDHLDGSSMKYVSVEVLEMSLSSTEIHNLLLTSLLSCSSKGDVDEMTKIISLGPSLLNEVVNVWMVILLR